IEERANRNISIGALHATLSRLEEKGYLTSFMGEATSKRGGRKKRYFQLTTDAKSALSAMKELRQSLWNDAQINLGYSK
ncbi:MAG: helix-turn-helix transcriptional regulator, partial [Fulvivirga sp.]|nr:helix-turn-helix transcriptional regulator [Fulvivirga sp.]